MHKALLRPDDKRPRRAAPLLRATASASSALRAFHAEQVW